PRRRWRRWFRSPPLSEIVERCPVTGETLRHNPRGRYKSPVSKPVGVDDNNREIEVCGGPSHLHLARDRHRFGAVRRADDGAWIGGLALRQGTRQENASRTGELCSARSSHGRPLLRLLCSGGRGGRIQTVGN